MRQVGWNVTCLMRDRQGVYQQASRRAKQRLQSFHLTFAPLYQKATIKLSDACLRGTDSLRLFTFYALRYGLAQWSRSAQVTQQIL